MKIKPFELAQINNRIVLFSESGYEVVNYEEYYFAYYGFKNKKCEFGWQFGYHVNKQTPKYKTEVEAINACTEHFETKQPRTRI